MRQFLDVVYQAVEFPLRIHLLLSSEGEAVQLFVVAQVAEYRLHRGKASAIANAAFRTVDADFHFVGEGRCPIDLALEERHLPGLGFFRGAQAAVALFARHTVLLRALKLDGCKAIDDAVAAVAVKRLACPPGRRRSGFPGRSQSLRGDRRRPVSLLSYCLICRVADRAPVCICPGRQNVRLGPAWRCRQSGHRQRRRRCSPVDFSMTLLALFA